MAGIDQAQFANSIVQIEADKLSLNKAGILQDTILLGHHLVCLAEILTGWTGDDPASRGLIVGCKIVQPLIGADEVHIVKRTGIHEMDLTGAEGYPGQFDLRVGQISLNKQRAASCPDKRVDGAVGFLIQQRSFTGKQMPDLNMAELSALTVGNQFAKKT